MGLKDLSSHGTGVLSFLRWLRQTSLKSIDQNQYSESTWSLSSHLQKWAQIYTIPFCLNRIMRIRHVTCLIFGPGHFFGFL